MPSHEPPRQLNPIGWREWATFPEWNGVVIKAKIDTGARTSALHAFDVRVVRRGSRSFAQFQVHPIQRSTVNVIDTEAELLEYRTVTSSGGHTSHRPVIVTHVALLDQVWPIELTLASRDTMGFRMLLGRQALRGRFLVDPGCSYLAGVPDGAPRSRKRSAKRSRRPKQT